MGLETLTDSSARIRANELITRKDSIENEIKEQEQILRGVILKNDQFLADTHVDDFLCGSRQCPS